MPKHERQHERHAWAEFVDLHARYQRSVHIERDAGTGWLEGYLLTPLVRSLIGRIAHELRDQGSVRAWSLTGPYGSGKSAFALFLAQVLSAGSTSERARQLLKQLDGPLHDEVFGRGRARGVANVKQGLVPVLATGERAPIEHILVRALEKAAREFWSGPGKKPTVLRDLGLLVKLAEKGSPIPTRRVVTAFENVAQKVRDSGLPGAGLLVVLDEAGKPLEHIARRSADGSDVHLLQELAEAANRSGDAPIVLLVLLHQAFEQYAADLSTMQRNEWAKVQGRFVDVPFQEPAEQTLRLIGAALERTPSLPKKWRERVQTAASTVAKLVRDGGDDQRRLAELLAATAALHPMTALALGPLFRSRLAQNERSLFAFLAANEPAGFREFLTEVRPGPDLYGLDRLYDYVKATFGERRYGWQGRAWAQVEAGLARLSADADALDARVLKTVGILGLISDDLPAKPRLVEAALVEPDGPTEQQVRAALDRLVESSHLVLRRYRNAYQLWDGSDLDIDKLVSEALMTASRTGLHERLERVVPPRPVLARRHLLTTGTLRFFDVRYVDEHIDPVDLTPSTSHADGFVWIVLTSREDADADLRQKLSTAAFWEQLKARDCRPVVVALPHDATELRAAAREFGALEWVQVNTPDLRDDPVARHELEARITAAEARIRLQLELLADGRAECDWRHGPELLGVSVGTPLAWHLSEICDRTYSSAPHVQNELLNRNELSSSAAAARRLLITAMVEKFHLPRLGFEGCPPEYAMYRSVLEQHHVHRESDGVWHIAAPKRTKGPGSLLPAWNDIDQALAESETRRIPLSTLYARLSRPPYGIKAGILPVIVLAVVLERIHEVAVYEEGAFVPSITPPVVERILRAPERFELQQFRLDGARESVFDALARSLNSGGRDKPKSIVPIVRTLVRLVSNLPAYAKNTQNLSSRAHGVRELLLRAREPGPLLFEALPAACECEPFGEKGVPAERVREYTRRLKDALRELEGVYPALLDRIERSLKEAFGVSPQETSFRDELATRARRLHPVAADPKLKSFLVRVADDVLGRHEWLVSVGTLLGKKPPESWHDQDTEAALLEARLLTRRFQTLESLLDTTARSGLPEGTSLVRVAIAEIGTSERERVLTIRAADEKSFRPFSGRLKQLVDGALGDLPRDAVVAALARAARDLMDALGEPDAEERDRP